MTSPFRRISLTLKMVLLTVIVGLLVWVVRDYIQTRVLKELFFAHLAERLEQQAVEDRIRFDGFVKAHHQSARLIASQKRFVDYVTTEGWGTEKLVCHERLPEWLPRPSVLRALIKIRYALLLDAGGRAREVYLCMTHELPPESLLNPTALMRKLSHNQAYMTSVDGVPFLVAAESVTGPDGKPLATLMLASPLDEEFLIGSQSPYHGRHLLALVTAEEPRILASTNPSVLPPGALLKDLGKDYLITGRSVFDYGASDLFIGFASFVPKEEVESLTEAVISQERRERAVTAFIFIAVFALIMFWVTKRIERLTRRVSEFSRKLGE